MKKLLLGLILIVISTSAIADFKLITISQDDNGSYSVGLDTKDIKKSGKNLKKAWITDNYGDTQTTKSDMKSRKVLYEFNCKDGLYRVLQLVEYSGTNGGGKTLGSFFYKEDFVDINPNTLSEMFYKAICN